jgi:TetR/AcrR family transcriptional repressor of nem operon
LALTPGSGIGNQAHGIIIDWSVYDSLGGHKIKIETGSTRDDLLQVGLRRIRAMGYASTGVKEILDEANVAKGSFYHYFPSKEAFAKEVLALYVKEEKERAERVLREGKGGPLKRLRRYFEELIKVYGPDAPVSGCLLGNLSLEIADHSDSIQSLLRVSFADWQTAVAGVLREAIERGDLSKSTDPDPLAGFLLNSYEGALLRSKADRSSKALDVFMSYAFDLVLKR